MSEGLGRSAVGGGHLGQERGDERVEPVAQRRVRDAVERGAGDGRPPLALHERALNAGRRGHERARLLALSEGERWAKLAREALEGVPEAPLRDGFDALVTSLLAEVPVPR